MSASDKKKLRKEQNAATMTERQLKEQKEAKKLKTYTLTFAVAMLLVVAIVIGVAVRSPINSVINRNTHAITFGEHELTTADFNYYYVDAINKYYSEVYENYNQTFGNYWTMFLGFNTGEPLNKQIYDQEKGTSWAQWFVDQAIENATSMYAIYDEAIKNNHKLTEDEQQSLDTIEKNLETMAKYYGYSSAKEYLRIAYGDGSSIENYKNYTEIGTYVSSYVTAYSDSLEYTNDQLREYEKDKYINYSTFDICYYLVNVSSYLSEGIKGEDGTVTYTDKQKADALAAAKKDADTLLSNKITTSDAFDKAVKALEINKDNKNAASNQLKDTFYEDLTYQEIKDWVSKDGREVNDFECVPIINKTGEGENATEETSGYLVILFQGRDDSMTNLVSVRHMLSEFTYYWDADGNKKLDEATKKQAKEKAEAWLKEWQDGKATEETFAELANKNSDDGDGKSGGLYEDVYPGQMVEKFNEWCFDKDRKPGDTGIVETEYGYHVMYFVGTEDTTYRDMLIENDMKNEHVEEWMEKLEKALKVEQVNLKGLEWDFVVT